MNKYVCGELLYNDEIYYFNFKKEDETVFLQPKKMSAIEEDFLIGFKNKTTSKNKGNLEGETSSGHYICFINIKLAYFGRGCYLAFVPAYIIGKNNSINPLQKCDEITKMCFSGECLDKFYFPKKIVKENDSFKEQSLKLEIDFKNSINEVFKVGKDIHTYFIRWNMPISSDINNVLNVKTNLKVEFTNSIETSKLIDKFLEIEKFFCFLNNRKKIKFESIIFSKEVPVNFKDILKDKVCDNTKNVTVDFELFISNPENEKIDLSKDLNCINMNDIKDNYARLFKNAIKVDFIKEYFPINKEEDSYVTNIKFIQAASAFESEFNKNFPNFKSAINKDYRKVKNDMISYLRKKGKNSKFNKQKKYCDYFLNIVKNIDGTLEERILFAFKKYSDITEQRKMRMVNSYKINEPKNSLLAKTFAIRRNKISHGEIGDGFTDLEVISYVLVQICIYCITFEGSGFSSDKIKIMIDKNF